MERETFLTGYCRTQDQSRMVEVVTDGAALLECDCGYGNCVFQTSCQIAEKIRELLNN